MAIRTYKFRVKDGGNTRSVLDRMARSVNQVWNFCKETQVTALRRQSHKVVTKKDGTVGSRLNFISGYDYNPLIRGSSKLLGLHSQTVQLIAYEYARRRDQFCRLLRWRGRRSLGWIPLGIDGFAINHGVITHQKRRFKFWQHRDLPADADIKCAAFTRDTLGRWFVAITFESAEVILTAGSQDIGIDIGIKTLATLSDGNKIDGPRLREKYLMRVRKIEKTRLYTRRKQAKSKRYGRLPKARQMAKLHIKIANARADHLHKESTALVREYKNIYVGNVPVKLMNRSKNMSGVSYDHGIGMFKQMIRYKAHGAGGSYQEINERDSTRTCSVCLKIHPRLGLGVRGWTCSVCETVHDRDVNAAINILRSGHGTPTQTLGLTPGSL